jgi:hypothetical protein
MIEYGGPNLSDHGADVMRAALPFDSLCCFRCLDDRDAGKVKHCYENDRRWR